MSQGEFAARWAARLGPKRWAPEVPLAPFTTFRVGGPAEWLAELRSPDEVEALVADAGLSGVKVTVIGSGSNVLVADRGVRGVVVKLRLTNITTPAPGVVRAEAGVTMNGLVRWTIGRGLAAVESWAGTPGTVGGAIAGNAHWAGRNIGDVAVSVRLVDRLGHAASVPASDMAFGYDTSRLKISGEILLSADFRTTPGNPAELREAARVSLHYRKATQPLALPSAGCIFQNPGPTDPWPVDLARSAGAVVDRAGLKGHRIGGASISGRHANFFVNDGHATADDLHRLIETARQRVEERFGVLLRDEIVYLGSFEHG